MLHKKIDFQPQLGKIHWSTILKTSFMALCHLTNAVSCHPGQKNSLTSQRCCTHTMPTVMSSPLPLKMNLSYAVKTSLSLSIERWKILHRTHEGHIGIRKCQHQTCQCVYGPGIYADIKCMVKAYATFQLHCP